MLNVDNFMKMARVNCNKKTVILLFALLIPVWLIGISNFLFAYPSHSLFIDFDSNNSVNLYPYNVAMIYGYAQVGNGYLAEMHDPQFVIIPPDHVVSSTLIRLSHPLQNSHSIQIYFAQNNEPLSEANSVRVALPTGSTEAIVNLPSSIFTSLRYDLDIFGEVFEVEGIYVSEFDAIINRQWTGDIDGMLMSLFISLLIFLIWRVMHINNYLECLINEKIKIISKNGKNYIAFISTLCFVAVGSIISGGIISFVIRNNTQLSIHSMIFYVATGLSIFFMFHFRGNPDKLFLSLSLTIGFLFIFLHPPHWHGWDQRIHFSHVVQESYVRNVSVNTSNFSWAYLSGMGNIQAAGLEPFSRMSGQYDVAVYSYLKGTYSFHPYIMVGSLFNRLPYIIPGLMVFIGRSLILPPYFVFMLGLIGIHSTYSLVLYFAIKRLNSGKHIIAVIAMFPTAFLISTTYGADYWVTSLTILGFTYFIYEVQNPEKRVELKNLIIMIGAFFLALGPKAIYFPLMFILYFLSRDKFETKKGYKCYCIAVSIAILFAVSSFVVPFIVSSGEYGVVVGDFRGGAYVDSIAQARFILQNPFVYARILLRFLRGYINVFDTQSFWVNQNFTTNLSYLGESAHYHLIWVLVVFVTITDRVKQDELTSTIKYKLIMFFLATSTVVLVVTALYVSFTWVGAHHISGVQGRYLFPIIPLFLYIVGSFKINNGINKIAYSGVVFGIMSFVLLHSVWALILPRWLPV